jgi:hypothetical protein
MYTYMYLDGLTVTSVEFTIGRTCKLIFGEADKAYVNTYVDLGAVDVYFVISLNTEAGLLVKLKLLQQAVVTSCLVAITCIHLDINI